MVLIDANVLLDLLTDDPNWADWSQEAIARSAAEGLAINPMIRAEVAGLKLLTRDATRYRTSFPTVALICPE